MRLPTTLSLVLTLAISSSSSARAQSSRAEEHAEQQAQKAARVAPYQPTRVEKIIEWVEPAGLLMPATGIYPFIGSVYPGGGLALGPGVRLPYSDTGVFSAQGAWSIRNYKLAAATFKFPEVGAGHVQVLLDARFVDAPRVAFYGVGPDSDRRDRATFAYQPKTLGVTAKVAAGPASLGGGFDYLAIDTGSGKGGSPSIDTRYTTETLPGINTDPTFGVARVFAAVDWRESPGYTSRGGLYRIDVGSYAARDNLPFDFRRLDLEIDQFVPLVRANWVLALRAAASITDVSSGHEIPYFLLPSLGSGTELRGYDNFRFRDRHRLLLTGEYRWRPSKFMDMALFYEAGKVAARRADLNLDHLRSAYGIGARFHAPTATALRFELARGDEGLRFIIGAGPVF